jgi:hypothetical protein
VRVPVREIRVLWGYLGIIWRLVSIWGARGGWFGWSKASNWSFRPQLMFFGRNGKWRKQSLSTQEDCRLQDASRIFQPIIFSRQITEKLDILDINVGVCYRYCGHSTGEPISSFKASFSPSSFIDHYPDHKPEDQLNW